MAFYPETLFQEITDHTRRAFLAAYARCGRVTKAADAAQTNWRNHYNWLKQDDQYAAAFAAAARIFGDFLEDEAIRRAVEGFERKVFYGGEHVDNETVYSDTLMVTLLRGAKPEKYREHVKIEQDVTVHLESSLTAGMKRLEELRNVTPFRRPA
jgi:hypothetical protein